MGVFSFCKSTIVSGSALRLGSSMAGMTFLLDPVEAGGTD